MNRICEKCNWCCNCSEIVLLHGLWVCFPCAEQMEREENDNQENV